jgi:D-alanyl-lipoteichoic acid acyltransferase DltB (MBOAT superfamily)
MIFKYYDFFRFSAQSLLEKIGFKFQIPVLEIILPVGLSFYIFKAISYNIDVFKKKIEATNSLLDFLIYIAFFPHLLSGPIARAGDFLPQLKNGGAKKIENLYENIALIFFGLFKKLAISSYLTLLITDDVFAVPENHSSFIIFLAVFAYTLVIYFDFSGYSDMAIGFAGLLGFKSPINFDAPYLATNIKDFWRRWHISLSNWVRDYIYIPLGGNKKGKIRKYFNLMVAMTLMGLWHGAAFHFIFWGFLHALALVFTHICFDFLNFKKRIVKIFGWFFTFNFVTFSWIFFRSDNMENAFSLIKTFFSFQKIFEPFKIYLLFLIILGFLLFLFERKIVRTLIFILGKLSYSLILILPFVLILIFKLSPDIIPSFIYFKF